jgi:hypothetical protein
MRAITTTLDSYYRKPVAPIDEDELVVHKESFDNFLTEYEQSYNDLHKIQNSES